MYQIEKEIEWDMGHRVPNHKSKCRNPHGHRFKAKLVFQGELITERGSSDEGMLIDFSDVKTIAKGFIDERLDHGFMFYKGDETMEKFFTVSALGQEFKYIKVDFIPTAENIAKYLFDKLSFMFQEASIENPNLSGLKLVKVKVWETPTSSAEYSGIETMTVAVELNDNEIKRIVEEWEKKVEEWEKKHECNICQRKNPFDVRPIQTSDLASKSTEVPDVILENNPINELDKMKEVEASAYLNSEMQEADKQALGTKTEPLPPISLMSFEQEPAVEDITEEVVDVLPEDQLNKIQTAIDGAKQNPPIQ